MPSADQGYRLRAAGYLRKQVKRLAAQLAGARSGDNPECVHQARVASRRLRAGLRVVRECFAGCQRRLARHCASGADKLPLAPVDQSADRPLGPLACGGTVT